MRDVSLVTTALEEFWDTSKPVVFLGEWCRRYSRRVAWGSLGDEVLPALWNDRAAFLKAYAYVNDVYENYLRLLSDTLNAIHGRRCSDRYWRIVAGPWLFHYIHILYDRYCSIVQAEKLYPAFTSVGLSTENHVTPESTLNFIELVGDDLYNLQLYTNILKFQGNDIACMKYDFKKCPLPRTKAGRSICSALKNGTSILACNVISSLRKKRPIVLREVYLPRREQMKLFLKTGFRMWPHHGRTDEYSSRPTDHAVRDSIVLNAGSEDRFARLLSRMLPGDIPKSLVEDYIAIEDGVGKAYPRDVSAIVSAVSWYFDESFKCWAAGESERGAKLIGIQHGGNYGIDEPFQCEEHELKISDYYSTWGWKKSAGGATTISSVATKLAGRKKIHASNAEEGLLYVGTSSLRYLIRFQNMTSCKYSAYIEWQLRFLATLTGDLRSKLRVRLHHNDYGWDMRERLLSQYPDLNIESWSQSYEGSLRKSRICIINNLSTTYTEALSVNKPTILFWDPETYRLRDEAKPYFKELYDNGLLYESPESAAYALKSVYDDVEGWWNENARQAAVKRFCGIFARTSPDAVDLWAKEIIRCVQ